MSVWYAEFSLHLGESLSRSIDKGLASSRYGLVVISPDFIRKPWPEYELRGLVSREIGEDRVILPIWHGVTRQQVLKFSPTLADKVALNTVGVEAQEVAIQLLREIRPDLYKHHPRAHEQKHWDIRESFECGFQRFGGLIEQPCPTDPRFLNLKTMNCTFIAALHHKRGRSRFSRRVKYPEP